MSEEIEISHREVLKSCAGNNEKKIAICMQVLSDLSEDQQCAFYMSMFIAIWKMRPHDKKDRKKALHLIEKGIS